MNLPINRVIWCVYLIVSVLLAACEQPGEALTDRKRRENEAEIEEYIRQNNLTATKTEQGIYFVKTKTVPTGQAPEIGNEVRYHYIARRLDDVIVDSTDIAGNSPAITILNGTNTRNITSGRYAAILNLKQGEEGSALVPSYLDDGRVGSLLLPQYAPVRYDLRVVSVRTENQQIEDYIKANNITVTTKTDDGIRVAVSQARPDSAAITTGKNVTITSTGRLLTGEVIKVTGSQTYRIGEKQLEPGLETALTKLRAGERATIIFPSTLGYSAAGRQRNQTGAAVPPYSPLVFNVEVTKVQ